MSNESEPVRLTPVTLGIRPMNRVYDAPPAKIAKVQAGVPKAEKEAGGKIEQPAETSSDGPEEGATIQTPSSPTPLKKEPKESSSASDAASELSAKKSEESPAPVTESGEASTGETEKPASSAPSAPSMKAPTTPAIPTSSGKKRTES